MTRWITQAHLLRLWRVRYQGEQQRRPPIESPATGERQVFASLCERCASQVPETLAAPDTRGTKEE